MSIISRIETTQWEMTAYILEKGGDINFEINWDHKFNPGFGNNKGTALDYIFDLKNKKPDQIHFSQLVKLFCEHVIIINLNI
jgi:hypothetical protein